MKGERERERESDNRPILFTVYRFPLVLEQLLVFALGMSSELVIPRKPNGQPLLHLSSKVEQKLKAVAIILLCHPYYYL